MDKALEHVNKVVFGKSFQDATNEFTKWSQTYDEDIEALGCKTAVETAEMFQSYCKDAELLLDVGGGTAAVVEILRQTGYNGTVDILDANLHMLVQGEKKQIGLRNIFCHCINNDGILPLKDESYDAITCSGSFIPNHIPATALKGLFNVIKKGGTFVVTTRSSSTESYKQKFDETVNDLLKDKKIEVLNKKEFTHFANINDDVKSVVYAFKKL